MKLKYKYGIWIILIHVLLGASGYYTMQNLNKPYLIFVLEAFIVLSFALAIWFYKKIRLPKDFLKFGKQIIREDDFNVQYLKTDNDQLNELYGVFNAMVEKISFERRISEEQNHFLKDVIDASPVGIILLDLDDNIASINPKAKNDLSLSDADIGLSLAESGAIINFDLKIRESGVISIGGTQKIKYSVSSFYYRGFHRKMLIVNDLQHEILEAEKSSYSKVIRMMAHEINNSVGPINSILNTVKDEYPNDKLINDVLTTAISRTESLNAFLQNFAKVVRLPDPILEYQDIVPCINSAARLLRPTAESKNIVLMLNLVNSLKLKIDKHQIEQVIINILKNSIDAVGQDGEIKVILTRHKLIILDNGKGITKEESEMLFTPFFTTKPNGQGVGLTIAQRVLVAHRFKFSLFTQDGWTEFSIVLNEGY